MTAPCRTFQHAHDVAPSGSEIAVLDTAGYGALHITKAISVINPGGVEAGISVASGQDAITIDAGASDTVNIRGLTIDGLGIGNNGITFHSASDLSVTNCVIRHFVASGVYSGTTVGSHMYIGDSLIADNGTYLGSYGIFLLGQSPSNPATASVERVALVGNDTAIGVVQGTGPAYSVNMTVTGSQIARSIHRGVFASAGGEVSVRDSTISYNPTALVSDIGSELVLAHDTLFFNNTVYSGNGLPISYGDNYVGSNGTNLTVTKTTQQ